MCNKSNISKKKNIVLLIFKKKSVKRPFFLKINRIFDEKKLKTEYPLLQAPERFDEDMQIYRNNYCLLGPSWQLRSTTWAVTSVSNAGLSLQSRL
jgi:hypothetical protein